MAKSDSSSYFRRSSVFWIVIVAGALGFYTWTVFWPQGVPYSSLGPLGALAKHLVDSHYPVLYYGWYLTWIIHTFEALFALKVCSDKGINSSSARLLWFVQTFFFGFASLGILLKYKPDGRSKRQ
ncbi:transmembrane protein 254 [Pimephales promelas]|uniref:transmembrane protein 254 n=1 Tax=Pimephales promelas TaxID=90988 RepID=UPI0019555292|nr:transmembrane protein 254 [Pimephales promelas]KAG1963068.1 transmembrane protein [Pimephales promelas]